MSASGYTMKLERVGDLVLLYVQDDERQITMPMSLVNAARLASGIELLVSGLGGDALNLLDVPGGVESQ
jgi:hypothetical protein